MRVSSTVLRAFESLNAPVATFVDSRILPATVAVVRRCFGDASRAKLSIFFAHAACAVATCALVTAVSCVVSPVLFRKVWNGMSKRDRRVWHSNAGTFFPAIFVPLFAVPAILKFPGEGTEFVREAALDTIRACGFSLGYMTWDLALLMEDPAGQQQAYGGKKAYYIFVLHHLFSIIIWPYAVFAGRCVWFINYFLVSEATNANMSLRWFLLRCKMEKTRIYLVNGLLWIPLFLGVRICVIPAMARALIFATWERLTYWEKIFAFTTLPLPSMLNIYWIRMILSNAIQYLTTGAAQSDISDSDKMKDA